MANYWAIIVLFIAPILARCQPFEQSELGWARTIPSIAAVVTNPIPTNGMLLWLRADVGVYNNSSGGIAGESNIVVEWADQSGNTNNAYQYLTNNVGQPVATPNTVFITNVVNGKPSIQFYTQNGTNNFFTNSTLQTPTTMTVFWVGKLNGNSFSPTFGQGVPPIVSDQGLTAEPDGASPDYIALLSPGNSMYFPNVSLAGWIYVTMVFNSSSSVIRLNGTQLSSGQVGSIGSLSAHVGYEIGQLLSTAGYGTNTTYYIPEYIEYTGVQTSNTIFTVESYLTNKYGL
jgi:hypothetical protein